MLSTFPVFLSNEGLFGNQLSPFESVFPPWDCQEQPFLFPYQDDPVISLVELQEPILSLPEPVISNSDSDYTNSFPVNSSSGSDDPNDKQERSNPVIDERKRKRMVSNRESAKRSRMRKQQHLENLGAQVNRLKISNQELINQLHFVTHHYKLLLSDNDKLRSESNLLRQRLWNIRQVLYVRELQQQLHSSAWPCNNIIMSMNEKQMP